MFKKKVPKTDLVRARMLRDRFQPTNDLRSAVMDVSAASRREKCHQRLRLRLHELNYLPAVVPSIAMSVSLCLSVCLSVHSRV